MLSPAQVQKLNSE
ncbi:hypothetical protein A2U01_0117418, partial [Trifolium medium]|nr:hypothetical protein [Trifolium medium]